MLIPAVSSFYMLLKTNNILQKETTNKNLYLLKNVVSAADNVFSNIDTLRAVLSDNAELAQMAAQTQLSSSVRYHASVLCGALGRLTSTHRYIEHFYIYYPTLDFIVSPEAFGESQLFYNAATAESGKSREQWKNRLDTAEHLSISEKTLYENGEFYDVAEFLVSLQFSFGGRCIAAIRVKKVSCLPTHQTFFPLETAEWLSYRAAAFPSCTTARAQPGI